jgi:hypothetical protein
MAERAHRTAKAGQPFADLIQKEAPTYMEYIPCFFTAIKEYIPFIPQSFPALVMKSQCRTKITAGDGRIMELDQPVELDCDVSAKYFGKNSAFSCHRRH